LRVFYWPTSEFRNDAMRSRNSNRKLYFIGANGHRRTFSCPRRRVLCRNHALRHLCILPIYFLKIKMFTRRPSVRPLKSASISIRVSRDNVDSYLPVAMVGAAASWRRAGRLKINASLQPPLGYTALAIGYHTQPKLYAEGGCR